MAPNIGAHDAVTAVNAAPKISDHPHLDQTPESESKSNDLSSNIPENYSTTRWLGVLVWPSMLTLPLLLSSSCSFTSYKDIFPKSWYDYDQFTEETPSPLGLSLGIIAVAIGQISTLCYFYLHRHGFSTFERDTSSARETSPPPIQVKGAPVYNFVDGVVTHLSQPEGFLLLGGYLASTWMFRLMPPSYYSFEGSIQYIEVARCLILQDGLQYVMHRLEHSVSAEFYRRSHKPHHKFTNPCLFDAFNGSVADTVLMILIPLYTTACIVRNINVWTYMAFGSAYANWLTLIHSEFPFPWDKAFRRFGLGTPGDHHVHHKFFKYNYGHTFMWWDRIFGTYRHPGAFAPTVLDERS